jgi:hypothetical protein
MVSRMADITVLPIDWLRLPMSCPALMAPDTIASLIGLAKIPLLVRLDPLGRKPGKVADLPAFLGMTSAAGLFELVRMNG